MPNQRRCSGYTIPNGRQFDYAVRRHQVASDDTLDKLLHIGRPFAVVKSQFDSEVQ